MLKNHVQPTGTTAIAVARSTESQVLAPIFPDACLRLHSQHFVFTAVNVNVDNNTYIDRTGSSTDPLGTRQLGILQTVFQFELFQLVSFLVPSPYSSHNSPTGDQMILSIFFVPKYSNILRGGVVISPTYTYVLLLLSDIHSML